MAKETFIATVYDGYASKNDAVWATAHDAGDAGAVFDGPSSIFVGSLESPTGPTNYAIGRAFLSFDTSSLGSGTAIISAKIQILVGNGQNFVGSGKNIVVVEGIQNQPIVVGDYGTHLTKTTVGGRVAAADITDDGTTFTDIDLNATGIGWINLGGTTLFCLRDEEYDVDDVAPAIGMGSYINAFAGRNAGVDKAAKLIITYVAGSGDREGAKDVMIDDESIAGYVLSCRIERGKDEELGHASAGICELVLDNFDGDFSPDNAGGAFYGTLDIGSVVEAYESFDGVAYKQFTGKIDTINPHGEPDNLTAYILAVDGMDDLSGENVVETPLRTDTTVDVLIGDVLDAVSDSESRSLDGGIDSLQIGWFSNIKAIDAIRLCEKIDLGYFYIDVDGTRIFENRHARWGSSPQHDFEDTVIEFVPSYSKKFVKNSIHLTGSKYTYDANASLLWSAFTGGAGAPFIVAGGDLTIWAGFPQPLYAYTSPVVETHWNANTSPSKGGLDVSSDISLAVTAYGQSLKLVFTNAGASDAYLVIPDSPPESVTDKTILIYGQLYRPHTSVVSEEDATSVSSYGLRSLGLDLKFKSNIWDLKSQAGWLRDELKDIKIQPTVKLIFNTNAPDTTILEQCIKRKISDRVTIKSTKLGIDQDFYINKVIHEWVLQEGGMVQECTWVLEEAVDGDTGTYWLLGVVGRGELGQNTTLGF
jgi:hypothetical protein